MNPIVVIRDPAGSTDSRRGRRAPRYRQNVTDCMVLDAYRGLSGDHSAKRSPSAGRAWLNGRCENSFKSPPPPPPLSEAQFGHRAG